MEIKQLEIARIIGEPLDPRKPYPHIVDAVCETDSADPDDYIYYFDVLVETDKVYVITSSGEVTQERVDPDTPASMTFSDLATPEYYIKLNDYASRKENVLARKKKTIERTLNSYENYKIITLLAAAASSASHENTPLSGAGRFRFIDLVAMVEQVQDYGDNLALITGASCDKDIIRWNWDDDKNQSLSEALTMMNIKTKIRLSLAGSAQTLQLAANTSGASLSSTDILGSTISYLVARDTEVGKPLVFVRKKMDSLKELGGLIYEDGTQPERLVFVSPNPITVTGSARYLAIGITGYEQFASAVSNSLAISKFTRS